MQNEITCPKCNHHFTLNEVMNEQLENQKNEMRKTMNEQAETWRKQRESEFKQQLQQATELAKKQAGEALSIRLEVLQKETVAKTQQLQEMQKKELMLLKEKDEMEQREKNFEIEKEKYWLEKKGEVESQIIKQEQEMFDLKLKEKDTQMESLKKTIDDLKRKSEQGSMQLQGEAQELLLEQMLRENFPFDIINEVKKGAEGADCIQTVRNNSGKECGLIIYESKRTKNWNSEWIDKLKNDMRTNGAHVAILVTQTFPKEMTGFGSKDGIVICGFSDVISMAALIRNHLIQLFDMQKREENKGDKMQMLYDYLTGIEFRGQMEAIAEGFKAMRDGITKERMQMEKIWKEREKQLEKVLLSTSGLYGSVKGIAGASVASIPLLDGEDTPPLLNN